MCLDTVSWEAKDIKEGKPEVKRGWKVFWNKDGKLYPHICWIRDCSKPSYLINKWIKDKSCYS